MVQKGQQRIARGQAGYVALYEYSPAANQIRIFVIRHQRLPDQAGFLKHPFVDDFFIISS